MTVKARSFAEALDMVKAGTDVMVKCPAHDDGSESLHMSPGDSHPVILKCFAGCELPDIMRESGFTMDEIMSERDEVWKVRCAVTPQQDARTAAGQASHIYEYLDENRMLLFEVLRVPQQGGGKTFRQRHLGPNGAWVWSMEGVRRVLYRLPQVLAAMDMGWEIWVVEGEKDVETLMAQFELHEVHAVATTSPMGAGKWTDEYSQMLSGAKVIVCADADEPGRKHARQVRANLIEHGCEDVTIKEPKQGCKDVTAHFEKGGKLGNLLTTVLSDKAKREQYGIDILQAIKREFQPNSFIIPNMLAEGDRMLVTAFEGHGKSELLRQLAAQVAGGIHPWGGTKITPQRVLFFDAENHPQQTLDSWQNLDRLMRAHGAPIMPDMLTVIESWDDDVDLLSDDGRAWFLERVTAFKPRLICMGPLYNMVGADLAKEEVVRKLKVVVNEARSIHSSAVIMEHHAPHKGPMDKKRTVRPYGSTMFLKWPDFGYGLQPVEGDEHEGFYEWAKLRFPRMRKRYFPTHIRWGTPDSMEFPWMEAVQVDENKYV